MSGLEALSVACNVMAVIDFGLKTVELCRRIYETGQPDPELAASAARLGENSRNVNSLVSAKAPHGGTAAELHLQEVVVDCLACAKEVEDEVARISPRQHGPFAKAKTMDTSLGVQILEQVMDSGQLNVTTLESLRQEQKHFVTKHARSQRNCKTS
ncbi:hypothetical protein CMUS01_03433 [Colletotrichum musicola]|uniref:Uncharacterized protein n=1 Tax=Colletotrichum musicola TaxID=2175873 RepID=A0A8H6U6K8_9PEZI|nr:hypothetical protein CMUS01_03433 [Colletotrichum musicola]